MADQTRKGKQDDGQRSDLSTRQARQDSPRVRALRSSLTKLELKVITCVYFEGLTVKETAFVLRIGEGGVKKILWNVTDRFCYE